jgi:DNA-binding transcriptional LysR family regulator
MDHEQLYTFLTIIQTKNYSEAAKILNVTQPTVTARIKQLENGLDCKLFNREGKTISLTSNGELFLQYATKTLAYMDEAKSAIRMSKEPGIKIGFSPGFSLSIVSKITNILKEQLNVPILFVAIEDSLHLPKQVLKEELDIVIVLNPMVHNNQLTMEYLFEGKLVLIVGKNHRLNGKKTIVPEDLNGETMIFYRRHTPISIDVDEKLLGIKNLQRIEVNSIDLLKTFVKESWGVGVIFSMGVDDEGGNIQVKPFREIESSSNKVYALYKKDSSKIDILRLVIPLLVKENFTK